MTAKEAKVLWACRKTAAYQELRQDWSEMDFPPHYSHSILKRGK